MGKSSNQLCCHFIVSGRVQGVGFRFHTRARALELNLRGWVQNLNDGRVEVLVRGNKSEMEAFQSWIACGPDSARVDKLMVEESSELPSGDSFVILEGGEGI